MFLQSGDVQRLALKLIDYCDQNTTIYGLKWPLLNARYPQLCPFFRQIKENVAEDEIEIVFGTPDFYKNLGLSNHALETFKQQLMIYASENLIKINAFLDSPYLAKYETDEVWRERKNNLIYTFFPPQVMSTMTFIANIGGMMGLCMGFSFVSLVEIFFFASQVMVGQIQKK